jgi:hypothetical protein
MPTPPVLLSETSDARHMDLWLDTPGLLFSGPAIDPMAGSHLGRSGLEEVMLRLKRRKLKPGERLQLDVRLPAATVGPETQAQLHAALVAHLDARIASEEDALHFLRRETIQSLRVGGLFLTACLVLSAVVDRLTGLSAFLQILLRESLIIAGWVGLWHPIDLLLYSWWPNRYRISLLKYVQAAELRLLPG